MSSTTADKINYLLDTKEEIRQAINEKFVDVPKSATFRSYANSIRAIPTGNKTCRFVIGTSTAGWTEKDCDYLCDGVDDQVEINAAIQALPSTGGEIKVLDGTYNITASIKIDKERVTFGGCGKSTIFKRMWKGSSSSDGVIGFSKDYITLQNFTIDGNKSLYQGSGIVTNALWISEPYIRNVMSINNYYMGIETSRTYHAVIESCISTDNGYYGLQLLSAYWCKCIASSIIENKLNGIQLDSAIECIIIGNDCYQSRGDYTETQHNLTMNEATKSCIIVGNNFKGKPPTVSGTGNIVENNLS